MFQLNKKHLLFLTTANLPTNPRLLKELEIAVKNHQVSVILWQLGNWSDAINWQMMQDRPNIHFVILDATRTNILRWCLWAIVEKLSRFAYPLFKKKRLINALVHTRRSVQIYRTIKNIPSVDMIVAHNLGALYPAYKKANKDNIPFIYDIEDYDPGIHVPKGGRHYMSCTQFLLKRCTPFADTLTSASPLIEKYTLKLIGGHPHHQVILNSFPQNEFEDPTHHSKSINANAPLKLVWFSQKISFGRGLEQFFEALSSYYTNSLTTAQPNGINLSLTLIGDMDPVFDKQIIQPFKASIAHYPPSEQLGNPLALQALNLKIIPPLSQPILHKELKNHDIGLALEPGKDLNNNLAISNKIIAYAQAGLYILATDTQAQKQFMEDYENIGDVCGQNKKGMQKGILEIIEKIETIRNKKKERFEIGKNLAWEKESEKLLVIWKDILKSK